MATGTKHNELFDTSSKSVKLIRGNDLIKSELEFLLGFQRYTLFFGNKMGLDADRFLHLNNDLATFNLVKSEVEKVLAKYGRVNIISIEMRFNKQNDTLEIDMELSPKRARRGNFNLSLTLGD